MTDAMTDPPAGRLASAKTVLARRAPVEPIRRLNFLERVAPSMWFTPGLFVLGALVLSTITILVDRHIDATKPPSWVIGTGVDGATALTATVAAAMVTFLAVVFSTTLVAIQLAGGQYSPRVVRVFVRSRLTHVTLGVFLATFVFALNGLVEVRTGDDPLIPVTTVAVTYLLLLASLFAFITFLHGMARMLRVQYLYQHVTDRGRSSIIAGFPTLDQYLEVAAPEPASTAEVLRSGRRTGIIQAIDRTALVKLAAQQDVWIELLVEGGEYIGDGTPIARVHGRGRCDLTGEDVSALFLLGAERTLIHDPGFVFRQLVDIAIRALSHVPR